MALNICAKGYTSSKIVLIQLGLRDRAAIWELEQRYEIWAVPPSLPCSCARTLLNPLSARLHSGPWTPCPSESMALLISSLEQAKSR